MIPEELEERLKAYLDGKKDSYYEGSIKYKGLRNTKQIDGSFRELYIVSFMVKISDQPYDGDGFYFAAFDKDKHHLVEIIGPQSYERIEK